MSGAAQAKPKRPRAVILGPTRELTDQILSVAKSISHKAKFRSACVNGGVPRASSTVGPCSGMHALAHSQIDGALMVASSCLLSSQYRM
jgi:hypothetical protein